MIQRKNLRVSFAESDRNPHDNYDPWKDIYLKGDFDRQQVRKKCSEFLNLTEIASGESFQFLKLKLAIHVKERLHLKGKTTLKYTEHNNYAVFLISCLEMQICEICFIESNAKVGKK